MAMGRPREFDAEQALESALKVFWMKGYEGTSMPDLTAAMGINRPSLYAAFGNKEQLFRKALDRYTEKAQKRFAEALATKTAREAVANVLGSIADTCACTETPKGCLLVQGALSCGDDAAPIREELARRRNGSEEMWRARFAKGIADGDLPQDTNAEALARYIVTVTEGLAVRSAGGATSEDLKPVVAFALKAFPG